MITILLVLGISLIFLWSRRKFYILIFKLTGEWGYPLLGSSLSVSNPDKLLPFLGRMIDKYGNLACAFFGPKLVLIVSSPEILEKIFTSSSFVNKVDSYKFISFFVGDGLLTSTDKKWNRHRRLLNPAFNYKVLSSFLPIFNKEAKVLAENFGQLIGRGEVDISIMARNFALDTAFQTTMGSEMHFQSGQNEKVYYGHHILLETSISRIFQPWFHNDFIFKFSSLYKNSKPHQDFLLMAMKDIIDQKIKSIADVGLNPPPDGTNYDIKKSNHIFIDLVLKLYKYGAFSLQDVQEESNIIMAAAFDTIATAAIFCLTCLAMFENYQEKLFEEIKEVFPEKEFFVTSEDISRLTYMEMVINETLRLLPPVPLVGRVCSHDFDIGNATIIPAGTEVLIDIFNTHRSEKIWGPNAKTFDPDHFSKKSFEKIHPFAFIPFTKGIRNCIGSRYAIMALKIMLSQLLRNFRFRTTWKLEDLEFTASIALKTKKPPLLEIYRRE